MIRTMESCESSDHRLRTAIYLAPALWGETLDMRKTESACRQYVESEPEMRLTCIYRDEKAKTKKVWDAKGRGVWTVTGIEAWERLLNDLETGAVEAFVIYSIRTVAPTVFTLQILARDFFLPGGIRFADVEAGMDTAYTTPEKMEAGYFKPAISAYRRCGESPLAPINQQRRKMAAERRKEDGQTRQNRKVDTEVPGLHGKIGVEDGTLRTALL